MNAVHGMLLSLPLVGGIAVGVAAAMRTAPPARKAAAKRLPARRTGVTAAEQVAAAEAAVRAAPGRPEGYHRLAAACMRLQRESADPALYGRAEAALREAERRAPGDYVTRKLLAWVLAGEHRFRAALALARQCARENPKDYWNYGILGDALTELGDYPAAVAAVQKMVDLRPGALSYARAAYQRRLHGDPEGALQLYALALEATPAEERESAAWCHAQAAETCLGAGRAAGAEREANAALALLPDYPLALVAKAKARIAAGDLEGALPLYRRAQERVPLPETVLALGDLHTRLGRAADAQRQYALFEVVERGSAAAGSADRRLLALHLADQGRRLDEALALARQERARRADVTTCDVLAWCLFKNGRLREAKAAMAEAQRLGTRDPRFEDHARMIQAALRGKAAGRRRTMDDGRRTMDDGRQTARTPLPSIVHRLPSVVLRRPASKEESTHARG
jgi:tetratricopeptide (TPR) repeat protein